jgi:hypothetical protein
MWPSKIDESTRRNVQDRKVQYHHLRVLKLAERVPVVLVLHGLYPERRVDHRCLRVLRRVPGDDLAVEKLDVRNGRCQSPRRRLATAEIRHVDCYLRSGRATICILKKIYCRLRGDVQRGTREFITGRDQFVDFVLSATIGSLTKA